MLSRVSRILLLLGCASLHAWDSQLLPWNGGAGQYQEATVSFNSRNWRLLDYSYVGYKLGAQPLASGVPCTVFNVSGSGDITAALQTAINNAQASGGVVRIPAGTFTLSAPLYITGNNVSIEGAGSNATFINVPASYTQSDPRYEGLFTFGKGAAGWNKGWIDRGTELSNVTATVQEGQMFVDAAASTMVAVGDWITLRQYFWPALSNSNSSSTWSSFTGWPSPITSGDRSFSFTYLRQVLSKTGNRLNLDAPIPAQLDPANNPIKIQLVMPSGGFSMRQNVGLSGLSITFADNLNDTSTTPARAAGAAVHFEGVRDGWVYDVVVRNFPRFAFQCESAARVTFLDCAVYDCQDDGGAGFGYGYHWNESQQILAKRCYAERVRHAYLCQHPLSNFNVFTQDVDHEARLGNDCHHSFVHGYLFDDHQSFEGTGSRMCQRGSTSGNAYECLFNGVFWNYQGDQGRGGGADGGSIFMNPSKDGWGMVIGGPGGAYKVFDGDSGAGDLINPAAGFQVGPTLQAPGVGSKDRNALYEGIGQAGLTPASLYETQLLRRLGSAPADYASSCSATFNRAPVVPSLYAGPGTLVYDSDHVAWVPQLGSGCDPSSTAAGGTLTQQCWADSSVRDHTGGAGGESAWITVTGTDFQILMDFTGPTQPRNTYANLSFWAYSSVAGLQLRVYVAQRQDGNYTDANQGSALVSIPTANAWTQVTVPMSTFGTGATLFNKVQLRSYSTNAGATVYVDDILLTGGATPTPSFSPTASPTRTPTGTATRSASPSVTPSQSPSGTPTASFSATRSATPTPTRTASPTLTRTPSASATATAVAGPWAIEAEGGVLSGTYANNSHAGYSATGYADGFDSAGDSCTVTFVAPSAGVYDLSLRYSAPYGPKINDLYVNGSYQIAVDFPANGGWVSTAPVLVYLNAGSNQLSIKHNWGYFELDRFDLSVASLPPVLPNASLVSPSPSAAAQALMCWLAQQYGNKLISGQDGPTDMSWLQTNTGRYPALGGFDMMDYSPSRVAHGATSTAVEDAIAWHAAGGIVQFQWHWNAPNQLLDQPGQEWWKGFYTTATTYDISYALANTGSQDYTDLIRDLDAIAAQLIRLRDAGVPVLWRPLHEAEGAWFWWGAKGPAACKQLYQLMFDRFTTVHGLNNLIWVWTTSSSSAATTWYPGDTKVDLMGPDIYAPDLDYGPLTSAFYTILRLFNGSKMIALTENGPIPDPALLQAQGAKWLYNMTWAGYENDTSKNSLAHVQSYMTDGYVLSRDELPSPVGCPLSPTPTPTHTGAPSPTATPTPSASPSLTPSPSASPTASASPTPACPGAGYLGSTTITGVGDLSGYIDGDRWNLPVSGTVNAIQFYVNSGSGQARVAVYADAAGAPGALLTQGGPQGVIGGVNNIDVPPVDLLPGNYWLFIQSTAGINLGYANSGGQEYYQPYAFGAFPVSLSGGAFDVWRIALLAVLCPLPTPTVTPTSTATETASPSATPSPSPSFSATLTASSTATFSASPTASPSFSVSPTATLSPSFTVGPSGTATPTASPSTPPTATRTASPSATLSATPSWTASRTPSPSLCPTLSASPPPSASPTVTPSATPTLAPTLPGAGELRIIQAAAVPNPDPTELRVLLAGSCDSLRVRLYSPAYVLLADWRSGSLPAGWSTLPFPDGLPHGLIYAELKAEQGGRQSPAIAPLRLYRLR